MLESGIGNIAIQEKYGKIEGGATYSTIGSKAHIAQL